jgi:hypothetical protein
MTRFIVTLAVALFGVARQAHAFCQEGDVQTCFVNGVEGTRTCQSDSRFGPCDVPPPPPPPAGTCKPKFMILSVVYAPPGKTGGGSSSAVTYGASSTLGSTVTSSQGFNASHTVTASVGAGVIFFNASASFGTSRNTVDATSEDVKKVTSSTINRPAPAADGIDHDQDQIWLWLGPTVDMSFPTASTLEWTFANTGTMDIQFLFVSWLKNPSTVPTGVQTQLAAYGITSADFPAMLSADPFANGATTIDPSRYAPLNMTFPYEPPLHPGDPSTTTNFTAMFSSTSTSSTTTTQQYSVGATVSGGINFTSLWHSSLKVDNTWTWTHTNFRSTSTGTSESASVTVGGPSFGYAGPTSIAVYYDQIYKTFLFAPFLPGFGSGVVEGAIVSNSDAPVADKEVVAVADGVTYRTVTNAAGEFTIYTPKASVVQLRAGQVGMSVAPSRAPVVITVP